MGPDSNAIQNIYTLLLAEFRHTNQDNFQMP